MREGREEVTVAGVCEVYALTKVENSIRGKHPSIASPGRLPPCLFFPSNAFMASARSFNMFNCMLQNRVNLLINAYTWPSAD